MKRKGKRLLSALLAALIFVAAFPGMTALAANRNVTFGISPAGGGKIKLEYRALFGLMWREHADSEFSSSSKTASVSDSETWRVTATPASGYRFVNWTASSGISLSGGATGQSNNGFSGFSNGSWLTANFVRTYSLTTSATGGSISASPASPTGNGYYDEGTLVTLTATPSSGYVFSNWSGVDSSNGNTATVTMNSNKSVSASFTQIKTITVSGGFAERSENDGRVGSSGSSYSSSVTVSLAGMTFLSTLFSSRYEITGVPRGMSASLTRSNNGSSATLTLSGTANSHQAADSTNLTIAFQNSIFSGGPPTSGNPLYVPVTFNDNPRVDFSGGTFYEAAANDGTIDADSTLTATIVAGGAIAFRSSFSASDYTVTGLPAGLSVAITRVSGSEAVIRLSGRANSHNAADSVGAATFTFRNSAFSGGTPANLSASFSVIFEDAPSLTADTTPFTESEYNDGTLTGGKSILLSGAHFADAEFIEKTDTNSGMYTISGVPAGLKAELSRVTDGRLMLSFAGAAVSHSATNSTNVTLTLLDAAFADASASDIAGTAMTFRLTFYDNKPIRVLEIYPSAISATSDGNFKDAASQLSGARYAVTSMSMNRFISLIDEVNGKYDIVYFGRGRYMRNATGEAVYGNDITNRAAGKVASFIAAGGLCIFHENAFSSYLSGETTVMMGNFGSYQTVANRPANVKVVSTVSPAIASTVTAWLGDVSPEKNTRPVLDMTAYPHSYRQIGTPLDSNLLEFTFRAADRESAQLTAMLYIDKNNDSMFSESELVETHTVNNGKYDTFYYRMPEGLTGVYFWKLVVMDAGGLKSEVSDVFCLRGEEMEINVLQVCPPGNTGDLVELLQRSIGYETFGIRAGEYKINITQVSVAEFNNPSSGDPYHILDLNGSYDMIIFGFADEYGRQDLDADASARLKSFIETGQSVMFTHDTIEWSGYRSSRLLNDFRRTVGQTEQVTATQVVRETLNSTTISRYGLNNSATKNLYGQFGPSPGTTKVSLVNSTALTLYPFNLEGVAPADTNVALTHYQYYKLDLEDPEIVPVYNLWRNDVSERLIDDAMNDYYTYTKGTITYSGTGHTTSAGGYPEFELKLFVNTIIKAYSGANHAPALEIFTPRDNARLDLNNPNVALSFRAYDYDFGDDTLIYSVFIDRENNGAYVPAKNTAGSTLQNIAMRSGDTINLDIPKDFSNARTFKLMIEVSDDDNAKTVGELTLINTELPTLTPDLTTDRGVYLVGDAIEVTVGLTPSGKVTPDMTINPSLSLRIPSGLGGAGTVALSGVPTFTFGSAGPATGRFSRGFPSVANAPGTYTLEARTTYDNGDGEVTQVATKGISVVSGNVEIYVRDQQGNPLKEVKILRNGTDTGAVTGSGGKRLFDRVPRGAYTYDIELPVGYTFEQVVVNGEQVVVNGGDPEEPETQVGVELDSATYEWKITYVLDLDVTISVSYYKLQGGRLSEIIGKINEAGVEEYNLRTTLGRPVRIVAMFQIPNIGSTLVNRVQLTMRTVAPDSDGGAHVEKVFTMFTKLSDSETAEFTMLNDGIAPKLPYDPVIGAAVSNKSAWAESDARYPDAVYLEYYNKNETAGFTYAGLDKWYYTVIDIDKADNQKLRIESIELTMDTESFYVIPTDNLKLINILDLEAPELR
ncbi:MAG: DUF5057 domain-containing protein [Clostridiales bacterium]|nr:DUF5057 domain-containing protein [Clostridiales bacterium]